MPVNTVNKTSESTVRMMTGLPTRLGVLNITACMGNLFLFMVTLIVIAIYWTKVAPWRQFKNYIFFNMILALSLLNASGVYQCLDSWPCCELRQEYVYELAMSAFANWMLIMCINIYTQIVKVFSGDLQHKYLKANAFAWGLPILELCYFPASEFMSIVSITHATSYVIFGAYLSVSYAMVKLKTVRMVSKDNSIQIMRILAYVTSAFVLLVFMQSLYYTAQYYELYFTMIYLCELIFIGSFLSMKTHRELWAEYGKGKTDQIDLCIKI